MTADRFGLGRASMTTSSRSDTAQYYENYRNPYLNATDPNVSGPYQPSNSSTASGDDFVQLPAEDVNNVVGNETVVIYQIGNVDWERERIRMEFYATYDVMTGLRIAGTLAAFFGLMVMLVMYKSRRALRDPKIAQVAAEMVQEEEDRELQQAFDTLEAAGIFPELETLPYRERRLLSLGNISAPPMLNSSPRFSSVGGGSCSLWDPPTRCVGSKYTTNSALGPQFHSPSGTARMEAFRSSRNSSSDRSQCVSFDMSEMGRRRSDCRAWMGRRATFQSIHSDSLKYRNKVFLSNSRQGRDSNRIKLIRLYTTSSSRDEDVDEVHGVLAEEDIAVPINKSTNARQQSTSSTSFVVSSIDYQDSDLRSVGSETMFSERYADTDEDDEEGEVEEKPSEVSSDDSEENSAEVSRLKSGAYQKLQQKRIGGRIDSASVATYEAAQGRAPPTATATFLTSGARPRSMFETRTFELHSLVPKSQSVSGPYSGPQVFNNIGEQNLKDKVQQMLAKEEQNGNRSKSKEWSKETLF